MQVKADDMPLYTPTRMSMIKKCCEDLKKLQPSYLADKNVKCYGKKFDIS